MMRSLYSAVSGLRNHQTAMDVIGNNIANVNTTGFKSSRVLFQDIFSQTIGSATAPTTTTGGVNAKQVGLGMTVAATNLNISQGSAQSTDSGTDLMISGQGYFVIETTDGIRYTRDGSLTIDSAGNLLTMSGDFVLGVMAVSGVVPVAGGTNGEIETINGNAYTDVERITGLTVDKYDEITIGQNGVISGIDLLTEERVEIARIAIATFNNPEGLTKEGSNYYSQSRNSGDAIVFYANTGSAGSTISNRLEMSNVDLANEMTSMIVTQRGFQANSRVITVSDSMLEELINLKR